MPAEDRVVIHVEVDADLAADRAKIEAFYQSLHRGADRSEKSLGKLERRMDRLAKNGTKLERMLQGLGRTLSSVFDGFGKFFSLLGKFSFVAMAAQIGLVSIALLGVKAAMVTGRFAVRAYQVALQGLGVTAGGVAVALGSIAAAMRQYQEVSLIPQLGSSGAAIASRNVMGDRLLSFYGVEGLQGAITALAQGGVDAQSGYSQILKQLGDYTADPKELAQLATIYSNIQAQGVVSAESLSGLGGINQSLVAGIAEISGLDSEALAKAAESGTIQASVFQQVLAGQAEATNAFEGQLLRLNSTIIGTLKGLVSRMMQLFADLGQPFIQTVTDIINRVETILTNAVTRIRGAVTHFGLNEFLPGMLNLFERFTDFMVVLVNESIPKLGDALNWLASAWDSTKNFFIDMARTFAPLEEGASVLWDFLKRALGPFFTGFGGLITQFNALLVNNEKAFQDFGDSIGVFMEGFISFFQQGNQYFIQALPIWGDLFEVIGRDIMPLLADFFGLLHDASMTVLPMVARILSQVANVLRPLVALLRDLMGIPGIGQLLGLGVTGMMFGLRGGHLGAMGGALASGGRGLAGMAGSLSGRMGNGLLAATGLAGMRGSAARGATNLLTNPNLRMPNMGGVGMGLLGGLGGGMIAGSLAGSNVQGSGGALLGGLGGAASGAAMGAMMGGIPGAIAGGLIGGITGVVMSQRTQRQLREAGFQAGQSFADQVSSGMDQALSRGAGRRAFTDAIGALNTQMESLEKNSPEWIALWMRRKEMQDEIDVLTDKMNTNLGYLANVTGKSTLELEHMADVMGVDLTSGIFRMNKALRELGILTDQDFTVAGARDNSMKILLDTLTGPGSVFERKYVAPETISTYEAIMREQYGIVQGGGQLSGDSVQRGLDSIMAYAQTVYGNEGGSAMAETLRRIAPELDAYLGSSVYEPLLADVSNAIDKMYDPAKNPSLMALQSQYMDYSQLLGQDKSVGEANFLRDLEILKGLDLEDFDTALGGMLENVQQMTEIERFKYFNEELDTAAGSLSEFSAIVDSILGPKRTRTPTSGKTAYDNPDYPWSPSWKGPSATSPSAGKTEVNSTANVRVNVEMKPEELFDFIERQIAAEIRRATQRGAQTGRRVGTNYAT